MGKPATGFMSGGGVVFGHIPASIKETAMEALMAIMPVMRRSLVSAAGGEK
jgi:hypothetical protein